MSDYPDHIIGDVPVVTALIGGCAKAGDEWILPEGKTLPSQQEIDAKREELKAEYDAKKYQRDRAVAYDPIREQLDQIYHDLDGWKAKIKAVKAKYPKP
jgi:Tfp pilus assembly protein PilO